MEIYTGITEGMPGPMGWILTRGVNQRMRLVLLHETTSRTVMEQLTHLIAATFSDVEKFESSNRHRHRYTIHSLYTALDNQLQDVLVAGQEYAVCGMRYVVRKLFDLKLQIHAIETEPSLALPADGIEHTIALMLELYSEVILWRSLFICVCTNLL